MFPIVPGDRVLARDPRTWEQAYRPVLRTMVTHPTELHHVRYRARAFASREPGGSRSAAGNDDGEGEPGELVATGEHPFYVVNTGAFVPAERLSVGDIFSLAGGGFAEVVALDVERAAEPFTTYNFEVDDFNTYLRR